MSAVYDGFASLGRMMGSVDVVIAVVIAIVLVIVGLYVMIVPSSIPPKQGQTASTQGGNVVVGFFIILLGAAMVGVMFLNRYLVTNYKGLAALEGFSCVANMFLGS